MSVDGERRVIGRLNSADPPIREGLPYVVLREFMFHGTRFLRVRSLTGEAITASAGMFCDT